VTGLPPASTPGALPEAVFLLATAFDSSPVDPDDEPPEAQAALWFARVWGGREGYACMWLGFGGYYTPAGKYDFERVNQRFLPWPDQRHRALDLAMATADGADVYVAPALRSCRSRKRGTALGGRVAWADCDGPWTADRERVVRQLAGVATMWQVASGNGRHVYLRLAEAAEPTELESINRRLAARLGGDAKWDATSLLRLPGTYNRKSAARGDGPTLVRWLP
jgi:hypothetical protein